MFIGLRPHLAVQHLISERDFYLRLGFQLQHESHDFVALSYGEILFGLVQRERFAPGQANHYLTWQISVQDVEAIYALCLGNGVDVITPPTLQAWGDWTCSVRTPNGYVLTFEQEPKE